MPTEPIRILLVDDHRLFRDGLRSLLGDVDGMSLEGEAASISEALQAVREQAYDVVLLDLLLGKVDATEIIQPLKNSGNTRVLVCSARPEKQSGLKALQAGADGYFEKTRSAEELIAAVRMVARGERYLSAELVNQLIGSVYQEQVQTPHERLSTREYQVFHRIAQGMAPKQIADELGLSAKTISTYRARILEKMDFEGNADIVRYALAQGLLPGGSTLLSHSTH